ncbi:FMRFamide receptor [Orchesella cincta]|uniref:FMRFamide receptor n=1 Tax=Orchesella cincta TaxID=48709 RepID=A0A1D2M1N4_ORCCI|nr:FMRFamide receptor [Orchesella cincta]
MRLNPDYILYYVQLSYLLVTFLIPFSILLFFNITIFCEVRKQRRYRNSLSFTSTNAASTNNSEDLALAGMLFGIVITFLSCNILLLVIRVMNIFKVKYYGSLTSISNFLVILGCSTNFVFYCLFGKKFRSQLARTLGMRKISRKGSKSSSNDSNFQMNSNDQTAVGRNSITSIISNESSSDGNQRNFRNKMSDTKPNAIENNVGEVSCSQVTVTSFLGD